MNVTLFGEVSGGAGLDPPSIQKRFGQVTRKDGDTLRAVMNRRQVMALLAISAPAAFSKSLRHSPLIGCWKLRSCVRTLRSGQTQYHFGRHPVGRIEYELRNAVTGFVAYFGTFDVDAATHTVIHHVQASLFPSWAGTDLKRNFHFEGRSLVLTRVSPDGTSSDRLVWDREPD